METRIRRSLLGTCVCIVMILCYISGVTSDVPDDVVYTDLHKYVRIGDSVVLTCRFRGTPLAVYWKKGDDPRKAPNLVSWIPTDDVTGLCKGERPCQIMEMNENRSLVIKEVSIAEEGRYVCRVSSYKGILIHNFTDIKLFSPPHNPFPVIHQCAEREPSAAQSCSISTSTPINITCMASRYYPDLDLFFLHGHNKITDLVTNEWTNHDGTKSKYISIKGSASETPYVCVASDIPGSIEQRVATILLVLPAVSTCVASDGLSSPSISTMATAVTTYAARPAKIVVPVVIVTMAGVCILIVCWRRQRRQVRTRRDQEEGSPLMALMTIKGKLSFYDLWMMLSRVTTSETGKLNDTLYELGIEKLMEGSKPLWAYPHLCQWKTDNVDADQADILMKALDKSSYHGAWEEILGLQRISAVVVSEVILEHILWHIGEPGINNKFLSELIPGRPTTHFEDTDGMSKLVQEPLRELKGWSKEAFEENPVVLLSLALEKAGCSPLDRTFFCVPDLPVTSDVVHQFVKKLASRHCSILTDLSLYEIESIVDENNRDLFDTESMINDWVVRENGSHIDKRCKLDHAVISVGRYDLKGYLVEYGSHISLSDTREKIRTGHSEEARSKKGQGNDNLGNNLDDAELHRIIRYLDKEQLSEIIGEHAEGDSLNTIKAWIEKESTAGQPDSCRQCLRAKLVPIGMEDLIPLEIKEDVCLVELVNVAFRLMMTDIYPLAEALDISADKLKSYKRQSLDKSKLSRGTMGVLVGLGEKTNFARSKLCDALAKGAGWQEMAHLLKYGYELSHGDLCAVGYGFGSGKKQCSRISKNLGIITKKTFTMNVLMHWKSLVQPPTYNPRTALADAVFPVLGKEKALDIISGEIRHSENQGNVIPFIRDSIEYVQALNIAIMIDVHHSRSETDEWTFKQVLEIWFESLKNEPLTDIQREELCKRLDDGGYKTFSSKLRHGKHLQVENGDFLREMENAIGNDVATNVSEVIDDNVKPFEGTLTLEQVLEEWEEKLRKKPLEQQERILLSNRLFKGGYTDFSFEVMLGFVPRPL